MNVSVHPGKHCFTPVLQDSCLQVKGIFLCTGVGWYRSCGQLMIHITYYVVY
jgi:hypothetical protein